MPKVLPARLEKFDNHGGTFPNTLPPYIEPILVIICVKPTRVKPMPRVIIRD